MEKRGESMSHDRRDQWSTLLPRFSATQLWEETLKWGTRCSVTHVSTDALEGERYELGVELVGGHAVDEEGEVFQ